MGIATDIIRVAANTSSGNQTFTGSLGGLTPKAAIFIVTQATVDDTLTDHFNLSYGAATGVSNEWCCSFNDEDGQGSTDSHQTTNSDKCIRMNTPGTPTVDGEAEFVSFGANAVTVNWTNAPGSAFLVTVILFAGSDLSAHANNESLGNTLNNAVDITNPAFEPDVVFACVAGSLAIDSSVSGARPSLGVVANDGSDTQRSHAFWRTNGAGTARADGRVTESYGIMEITNAAALDWGGEFGTFDANGFTVTTRIAGANNAALCYLALSFGGAVSFWVGTEDTPVAGGNDAVATPTFTPQFVFALCNQMEAIDTANNNSALAGPLGVGGFTDTNEFCSSVMTEENVGTSNTKSIVDDTAIEIPDDDGTAGLTAAFVSMDANGWTLNWSAVKANAKKFLYLAIEEEAVAAVQILTKRRILDWYRNPILRM